MSAKRWVRTTVDRQYGRDLSGQSLELRTVTIPVGLAGYEPGDEVGR